MKDNEMKMKLLKMLKEDMMSDEKEEMMEKMMPKGKMKATIVADDEEGLIKGAKEVPKALSKAEEFMKLRMGGKKEK